MKILTIILMLTCHSTYSMDLNTFIHFDNDKFSSEYSNTESQTAYIGGDARLNYVTLRGALQNTLLSEKKSKTITYYSNSADFYSGIRLGSRTFGLSFEKTKYIAPDNGRYSLKYHKSEQKTLMMDYQLSDNHRVDIGAMNRGLKDYANIEYNYKKQMAIKTFFNDKEIKIKLELTYEF